MNRVAVKFFATLKETVGVDELELTLDRGDEVSLRAALTGALSCDALEALYQDDVRIAVNQTLVHPGFELSDGDEVAFLPPVTGG